MLHPEFFTDPVLADCSDFTRLVFAGLWLLADREGRLLDNVRMIDGAILPHDPRSTAPALAELAAKGRILRYCSPAGNVIQVVNFKKWQHIHPKEAPSKLPDYARNKPGLLPGSARENIGLNPSASTSTSTSTSTSSPAAPTAPAGEGTVHPNGGCTQSQRRRAATGPARGRPAPHVTSAAFTPEQEALLRKHGFTPTRRP
jgi:hypothetical protein